MAVHLNRPRNVRISDFLWEKLAELAERNGNTIAEELRVALENWLDLAGMLPRGMEERRRVSPSPAHRNVVRSSTGRKVRKTK